MSVTLGWSAFGIKNNARNSGNSYSNLSPMAIVSLVMENWSKAVPGQGETTLDRKILVPVPPEGFFCPPRANLVEGMVIKTEVKVRQDGEDPYTETYVEEAEARRCNALVEVPAKRVDVVCYSADALLENNGTRTNLDCNWEIVCLLASTGEKEPMLPLAMARNYLEMPGGTKGEYTAKEFAEAIYYWSSKRGVKVKLHALAFREPDVLLVEKAAIRTNEGRVFTVDRPGRHHDVIRLIRESGYDGPVVGDRQGFVLSDGRFVMRKAALLVATKAGQVERNKCQAPEIGLFSEDVW